MISKTINKDALLTHPVGGRGAKKYIAPLLELITLDNEISLALASSPPIGPDETYNAAPDFIKANPFKIINS